MSTHLHKDFYTQIRTIAVVGLSPKADRSSYGVASYLQQYFRIIPVNPMIEEWNGIQSYASILHIPESIDCVNIFRRSEEVLPIVEDSVQRNDVKVIWMQLGVINQEAKALAEKHGIYVVMDECLAVVHRLSSREGQ